MNHLFTCESRYCVLRDCDVPLFQHLFFLTCEIAEVKLTEKAGLTEASALALLESLAAEIGMMTLDLGAAGMAGEDA